MKASSHTSILKFRSNDILKIKEALVISINPDKILIEECPDTQLNRLNPLAFYDAKESIKHRKFNKSFLEDAKLTSEDFTTSQVFDFSQQGNNSNTSSSIVDVFYVNEKDIDIDEIYVNRASIELNEDIFNESTVLTESIGQNENGEEILFYFNPKCLELYMSYCTNEEYVYWGGFQKRLFFGKNYEHCTKILIEPTQTRVRENKSNIQLKEFEPLNFYPLLVLGLGAFGLAIIVLKKIRQTVTSSLPYALKIQENKNAAINEDAFYNVLEHPNILRKYESYQNCELNLRYMIFELLPYGTLKSLNTFLLQYKSVINLKNMEFLKIYTAQILMALDYIHKNGLVHFDIKPANIGIGYRGYIKIFDFGISCFTNQQATPHKLNPYACKEKRMGHYFTTQTDIYGFCIIFCELYANIFMKTKTSLYIDINEHDVDGGAQILNMEIPRHMAKYKSIYEIYENSNCYDSYDKRKSATELFELPFYKQLNSLSSGELFRQELDLEKETNLDLRKLFIFVNKENVKENYEKYMSNLDENYYKLENYEMFNERKECTLSSSDNLDSLD